MDARLALEAQNNKENQKKKKKGKKSKSSTKKNKEKKHKFVSISTGKLQSIEGSNSIETSMHNSLDFDLDRNHLNLPSKNKEIESDSGSSNSARSSNYQVN